MSLGFDAVVEVPVVLDGQVVMLLSGGRVGPRIEPPQTLHEHRHRLTDETHETLLRRALANGEALQTTLEALLEFAHVERAGIDGGLARVDVVALVHGSVDPLSSLPAGHDVRVDTPPEAPVCVAPHQLERVVDNLLLNAARHTAEDLPRLTDRFFRGGHGDTRETRGPGAGADPWPTRSSRRTAASWRCVRHRARGRHLRVRVAQGIGLGG